MRPMKVKLSIRFVRTTNSECGLHEHSGHNQINNWATLDLKEVFLKISTVIVIENYHLRETLIPALKNSDCALFNGLDINDLDLLFVVSDTAEVKIYAITNISQCPPTKILFTPISENYHFGKNEYPLINTQVKQRKYQAVILNRKSLSLPY